MKVQYFKNKELKEQEISTLEELEVMSKAISDGNIIICMNGYEYTLCEEDNAPIGNSFININYVTGDEVESYNFV